MFLLAVHIADGILDSRWCVAGYVLAALLALVGAWGVRDDEIPKIALISAVFFVASQIHIALGVSSAHLLLNGFVGVILGRRALLAIPVGLSLQAALFGHGGFSSLGVNSVILSIPAMAAAAVYLGLRAVPWAKLPVARFVLVALSVFAWATVAVGAALFMFGVQLTSADAGVHVGVLLSLLAFGAAAAWGERRIETAPEFPIGLCVGELAVLGSLGLHCVALIYGGTTQTANHAVTLQAERFGVLPPRDGGNEELVARNDEARAGWRALALVELIVHLPIAALEALILGFVVGFLVRVKPELIGWPHEDATACTVQPAA